ncbi:MAG TPA: GNAT family N-acetyltransferase [Niastella sp.]
MTLNYRAGKIDDLKNIKQLALKSWEQFQPVLTDENWETLSTILTNDNTYINLLNNSQSIICTTEKDTIIGMAFLVSSGNPTDLYDKDWSYIRFVTVDPDFGGQGIGKQLTKKCIDLAKNNGETTIALHTSEIMNTARHIYEALGFTILKEIDQRFGIRYWLYTLDIGK